MKLTITEKADAVKPIKPQLDDMPMGRLLNADRDNPHTTQVERDANCRLAACAPELLEALELCADFIKRAHGGEGMTEDERWSLLEDALNEARAAIQKARDVK